MILLTGGTGFIGSYLLYYLLAENRQLRAIKRHASSLRQTEFIFSQLQRYDPLPAGESWQSALARVEWVDCDLLDVHGMEDALEGVDEVYHAAAIVSFNSKKKADILRTNVEGTANLVNICLEKGVRKLGFISSVAALARRDGQKVDETAKIEGRDFTNAYSESKYRAEMEVWRAHAEGLPVVMVNPGVVLGWGDFALGNSTAIFKTVRDGLKFYPQGSNAFVDARDVAKALIALMKEEKALGERFILTSATVKYEGLFNMIAHEFGMMPPSIKTGPVLAQLAWVGAAVASAFTGNEPFITRDLANTSMRDYDYDPGKIEQFIGHKFIPIEQTVRQTCEVYKLWERPKA